MDLTHARRRVDEALEHYGTYFKKRGPGAYQAIQGSAEVFVDVELEEDEPLVRVRAAVSHDSQLNDRALLFLLQANDNLPVATFSINEKGTVFVGQTLFVEYLHAEELRRTVRSVAIAANCLDEILTERLEGKRSIDVKPWIKRH